MNIVTYSQGKHWEIIKEMLENDQDWKALIWEIGLYEPPKDCDFWDYRWVMIDEKKIVWFIFCGWTSSLTNQTTLKQLYVTKDYRKKWVGQKLVEHVEKYYREVWVDYIKITAVEKNTNAVSFYKRLGYIQCWYEDRGIKYKWKLEKIILFDKKL